MENLEYRYLTEVRANKETGTITGTAITFNKPSIKIGGQFTEVILPQAATEDFLKTQEIRMTYNHQQDYVLARYKPDAQRNSLRWNVTPNGVDFEFRAKAKDQWLLEDIANGDISAASFGFKVGTDSGSEKWEKRSDGYYRTISKFNKVGEFSIVVEPAYEDSVVSLRGLDELKQKEEADKLIKEQEQRSAEEKLKLEAQKKVTDAKELAEYYKKYDGIINTLKK
jgi:HK97 family phage prohead protease